MIRKPVCKNGAGEWDWHFDYVLQTGLNLGSNYTVSSGNFGYFLGNATTAVQLTGVACWAMAPRKFLGLTSTVSGAGDQGGPKTCWSPSPTTFPPPSCSGNENV